MSGISVFTARIGNRKKSGMAEWQQRGSKALARTAGCRVHQEKVGTVSVLNSKTIAKEVA